MPTEPTRILLADDHALVRRGVRMILDAEPDLTVVAEAGDGAEAVRLARDSDIDLAVLDVSMPLLTGLQAATEILRRKPQVVVLMLSMYDHEQYFFESLRVGASGYVLKRSADDELIDACRAVMRGEPFVYPSALGALLRDYLRRVERGERAPRAVLTERESQVVKLVAEGLSTKEIAEVLMIAPKTVERHRANILDKLQLRDRTDLTRFAVRAGLIEP